MPSDFSIIIIIIIEYLADLHSTETIRLYRKVPETCATGHQRIKRTCRAGWKTDRSTLDSVTLVGLRGASTSGKASQG